MTIVYRISRLNHRLAALCFYTYASIAMAQGETVLTVGRLLGHRDPETTLKYTHLSDTMSREATDAVGAILKG